MRSIFAARPDRLFDPSDRAATLLNVEDPATDARVKVVLDDRALGLLDPVGRRLLVEGYAYRYVIRGDDVVDLRPRTGVALSGVELRVRIGGTVLALTLYEPAMGFLGYLRLNVASGGIAVRFEERLRAALGLDAQRAA